MIEVSSLLVFPNANDVSTFSRGGQLVVDKFTDDFNLWLSELLLDKLVAVLGDDSFCGDTIHTLLLELLSKLELYLRVLEG